MGRGLAYRRAARERAVAHALPVVRRFLGALYESHPTKVLKWADNLKKCSCNMCNSGDPHDHRQFRRADAALRDEMGS
jgi:hypothetical protein